MILSSSKFGAFEVLIKVSLENYNAISDTSNKFSAKVFNCGDISLTAVEATAPTAITYMLFGSAHTWQYSLSGHFDVCDGVVALSLVDFVTGNQAPSIFSVTYDSSSAHVQIAVETSDRVHLGNHKLRLKFTKPTQKTLPLSTPLLEITVADPCDADIWEDADFGTIAYTFGRQAISIEQAIDNSISANFCEIDIVDIDLDWQGSAVSTSGATVTATNTKTSLSL